MIQQETRLRVADNTGAKLFHSALGSVLPRLFTIKVAPGKEEFPEDENLQSHAEHSG